MSCGAASVTRRSDDGVRPRRRASLSDAELATLKHRAEEALAGDGVERTSLGYNVLVKLKLDDRLEQAYSPILVRTDGAHPPRR
jgi:hypothetical protein